MRKVISPLVLGVLVGGRLAGAAEKGGCFGAKIGPGAPLEITDKVPPPLAGRSGGRVR